MTFGHNPLNCLTNIKYYAITHSAGATTIIQGTKVKSEVSTVP